MGLFDTVYVSEDVAAGFELRCAQCGQAPPADYGWQTKSLDSCLLSYVLRHDEAGAVRLYLLDRPSDRLFWRAWTDEEAAFLPGNRRQRFMGELPHQWVEIYASCGCGSSIERWIKFCDGIAVEYRTAPPRHASGFFDDAGDFRLPP